MKTCKLIVLSCLVMFVYFNSNAQTIFTSDFEDWTGNVPNQWFGVKTNIEIDSIYQYANSAHSGTFSCRLQNRESSHKRFTTQALSVTQGESYNISFWVRGKGKIRVGLFDGENWLYNTYIDVNSTAWEIHSQSIVSGNTATNAEFILSLHSTDISLDDIQVDDVVITEGTVNDLSIYQIQFTENASGVSPYNNQSVRTTGVVTAVSYNSFFIQDGQGAWNGIYIYSPNYASNVQIGNSVEVLGTVMEYENNTQISNLSACNVLSTDQILPEPNIISAAQANTEPYESTLVEVQNAICVALPNQYGEWIVNDGDDIKIDDFLFSYTPSLNYTYSVTGPAIFAFESFRIYPRDENDIVIVNTSSENFEFSDVKVFPNPVSDRLFIHSNKNIEDVFIYNASGRMIFYENANNRSLGVDLSKFANGIYAVRIKFVDTDEVIKSIVKY
jgi:hypothetical protein